MSLIRRPRSLKMAPPGFHVVKRHVKISENGIKYFVKAHLRKNRGKQAILLPENILYLYWYGDQDYPRLGVVAGFQEYPELDSVIQFWLNYWKDQGLLFPKDLTPLHIKVLIAKESSFRTKADPGVVESSAYGLMQITNTTRQDLRGETRNNTMSLRDYYVDLDRKDLEDPIISIAAGIRWISYKYSSLPKRAKKDTFNTFRNYYRYRDGKEYAQKIFDMYNNSVRSRTRK
jgi:hypothetical protein